MKYSGTLQWSSVNYNELNAFKEKAAHYYDGFSETTQQIKTYKPYYDADGSLHYNRTLPEITIIPDSKLSPAERNYKERQRQHNLPDYYKNKDREFTELQSQIAQKEWNNSTQRKALEYGQTIASGIGIGTDIISHIPVYSSLKGASTLNKASSPEEYIEAGLWLTPLAAKSIKSIYNSAKAITSPIKTTEWEDIDLGLDLEPKPVNSQVKKEATERMMNFINSRDYQQRLQNAGLEKYWNRIGNYVERRIDNQDYFQAVIEPTGEADGLSHPIKGISISRTVPESKYPFVLDHEIAHYSTANMSKYPLINYFYFNKRLGLPYDKAIAKVIGYNDKIVPTLKRKESIDKILKDRGITNPTKTQIEEAQKVYRYLSDPQEKRARAYAALQEAKKEGLSIDEYVDRQSSEINDLNILFKTPEDLKKYLKNFLSVSAPVSMGIEALNTK